MKVKTKNFISLLCLSRLFVIILYTRYILSFISSLTYIHTYIPTIHLSNYVIHSFIHIYTTHKHMMMMMIIIIYYNIHSIFFLCRFRFHSKLIQSFNFISCIFSLCVCVCVYFILRAIFFFGCYFFTMFFLLLLFQLI